MTQIVDPTAWVYVVVQNPGANETIVGQQDPDLQLTFIPVFKDKESALQGMTRMAKAPGQICEVQAIIHEDLLSYARQAGFLLFFLDGSGRVLAKIGLDGHPL
jgi:hypothetical protein